MVKEKPVQVVEMEPEPGSRGSAAGTWSRWLKQPREMQTIYKQGNLGRGENNQGQRRTFRATQQEEGHMADSHTSKIKRQV